MLPLQSSAAVRGKQRLNEGVNGRRAAAPLPLVECRGAGGLSLTIVAMPWVVGRWAIRAVLGRAAVVRSIALTGLSAPLPAAEVLAAAIHSVGSLVVIRPAVFLVAIRLAASPVVFTGVAEVAGKSQAKFA